MADSDIAPQALPGTTPGRTAGTPPNPRPETSPDATSGAATPTFTAEHVSTHVIRIHDPHDVLMYLTLGAERALLIDTGYGVGNLADFVASLTDLPITVALTHGHVDHAFGASQFPHALLNPADLPTLAEHQVMSTQMHAQVAADSAPTPYLAPAVDAATLGALEASERIDLGGLGVRTLGAPGHTPGSLAFLVEEDRLLITGDAANQFTFLFLPESSTVRQYAAMLRCLREETSGTYDRILVSHGSGEITTSLFEDLLVLCGRILERKDDAVPLEFMGQHGLVARRTTGRPHPDAPDGPGVDEAPNIVYDPERL